MSGRRAHRRWGRRPSTGGGVDRLKMSARQAAMLGCNNNIFSNKINYSCIAVELKTIVKGSQIEKGPKHLASFLVSQIHNLSHAESLFE
jgi:hypothetical protein